MDLERSLIFFLVWPFKAEERTFVNKTKFKISKELNEIIQFNLYILELLYYKEQSGYKIMDKNYALR